MRVSPPIESPRRPRSRDDSRRGWRYGFSMSDQDPGAGPKAKPAPKPSTETSGVHANADAEATDDVKELTPEEQMAAFEEEMKNEDWGHQPC